MGQTPGRNVASREPDDVRAAFVRRETGEFMDRFARLAIAILVGGPGACPPQSGPSSGQGRRWELVAVSSNEMAIVPPGDGPLPVAPSGEEHFAGSTGVGRLKICHAVDLTRRRTFSIPAGAWF